MSDAVHVQHRFAVIACSDCRRLFSIELRHASVTCARCGRAYEVRGRRKLWEGDDARLARAFIMGATAKGDLF